MPTSAQRTSLMLCDNRGAQHNHKTNCVSAQTGFKIPFLPCTKAKHIQKLPFKKAPIDFPIIPINN